MNNQSTITKLVLKLGLAKNEKQVPIVLMAIIVLMAVVMFIAWPKGGTTINDLPSPDEIRAAQESN